MPPASGVLSCGSTGYSSERSSRTVPARLPADAHPVETGVGAELSRNKGPRCSDKLPAAQLDHEVAEGLRRKQGRLRGRDKGVGPDSHDLLVAAGLGAAPARFRTWTAAGDRTPWLCREAANVAPGGRNGWPGPACRTAASLRNGRSPTDGGHVKGRRPLPPRRVARAPANRTRPTPARVLSSPTVPSNEDQAVTTRQRSDCHSWSGSPPTV